jgi:hypothetical protein
MEHGALFRANDASGGLPAIEVHQAWWAMTGLGTQGREWLMEEKFEEMDKAGFQGVLGTSEVLQDAGRWARLLCEHKFKWGIGLGPWDGSNLIAYLEEAKALGALYANIQAGDAFMVGDEAIHYLTEMLSLSKRIGIPCFIETHRGRITQDLLRTSEYVHLLPDMRLTIDLSHYVLAGEMQMISSKAETCFDLLLQRCSSIHLRISNGQQIQVNLDEDLDHDSWAARYADWWCKGIANWRKDAVPGDILPLVCELGPPDYAMVHLVNRRETELSDRWKQSLIMKRFVEQRLVSSTI